MLPTWLSHFQHVSVKFWYHVYSLSYSVQIQITFVQLQIAPLFSDYCCFVLIATTHLLFLNDSFIVMIINIIIVNATWD
jgi:hypothetical protein